MCSWKPSGWNQTLKEAMHSHHSVEGRSQKSLGFILSLLLASNRVKEKELNLKITKKNSVVSVCKICPETCPVCLQFLSESLRFMVQRATHALDYQPGTNDTPKYVTLKWWGKTCHTSCHAILYSFTLNHL